MLLPAGIQRGAAYRRIRPVDVMHQQRVSTPFIEFDVGYNEHVVNEVEFDGDTVDFCFWAPASSEDLRCYVQLTDPETLQVLTNGTAELLIPGGDDDRRYLSFSGFGYLDEAMTTRVGNCQYEVWLDGDSHARVTVFV
jgi:hypothetical protein